MARPKSAQNRADQIIQTAQQLFAHYGYERTSIEDIARQLDIGKGSVYLEFRTKDEILYTILVQHAEHIIGITRQKLAAESGSPLQAIREVFQEASIACYDRVTRDIHTPETLLHSSINMRGRFADFFTRQRRMLLELLQRAAAQGEIPQAKATDETALAMMQATSSLFPPYLNNYSERQTLTLSRAELIKSSTIILDLLIEGLKSRMEDQCRQNVVPS
jgi:AcrR family transcriptional regulator